MRTERSMLFKWPASGVPVGRTAWVELFASGWAAATSEADTSRRWERRRVGLSSVGGIGVHTLRIDGDGCSWDGRGCDNGRGALAGGWRFQRSWSAPGVSEGSCDGGRRGDCPGLRWSWCGEKLRSAGETIARTL